MRSGETPDWAVDAAVESAQAARARRAETVRAVCAEMRDHSVGDASEAYYDRYAWDILIDRILAAHEREMAAVMAERDAEILRRATLEREIRRMHDCCDALEDEMDAKDAEIARLKAGLTDYANLQKNITALRAEMTLKQSQVCAEGRRARELEREMAAKDAEIARLKAGLNPVMACETKSAEGSMPNYMGCWDAVRKAQRIYKEGENHD